MSNQQAILTAIQEAIRTQGPIIIRNIIYRHSSDCEIFRGTFRWDNYDLFYAPKGIRFGLWSIWPVNCRSAS